MIDLRANKLPTKKMTKQTVQDLIRIAIAKHGEDRAWSLAMMQGDARHKKSWELAIAHPVQSVDKKLEHQIWQEKMKANL